MGLRKQPELYIIEATSLDFTKHVLDEFDARVTRCQDEIGAGVFLQNNVFLFLMPNTNSTMIKEKIFSNGHIRMHRNVARLEQTKTGSFLAEVYNIYLDQSQTTLKIGLNDSTKVSTKNIFPDFDMRGYVFRVNNMPYSFWTSADYDITATDPRRLFANRTGSEIAALEAICRKLNCKYDFYNTINMVWGSVWEGGANGQFEELRDDMVDIALGNLVNMDRTNLTTFSYGFWIWNPMTLIAKKPNTIRSTFDLLKPLGFQLWLWVLAAVIIAPLSFVALGRLDVKLSQRDGNNAKYEDHWTSLTEAFWYSLGTLLGENLSVKKSQRHSWTLKLVAFSWFMFAFLLTASYGGNLRAILLTPRTGDKISTVKEIVNSGLPWSMPVYGEEIDIYLAEHHDPDFRKLWEENQPPEGFDEYQYGKLKDVHEGKALYLTYGALANIAIETGFTHSNGEAELYGTDKPFDEWGGSTYFSWFFQSMNPWIQSNNLVRKYRQRSDPLPTSDDFIIEMKMKDNFGIFIVLLFSVGISMLAFISEIAHAKFTTKSKKKKKVKQAVTKFGKGIW